MRDSAWRLLGRWMTEKDWNTVLNAESCEDKFRLLMMGLTSAIDTFLPRKIDSANYKFWRNKVQCGVKKAKNHYYHDEVAQVESINSSKWWRQIKSHTVGVVASVSWGYLEYHITCK
ncbi:unnamed protein product [Porites evermanni]|uniref:Uncharacterized protein n=1 Tax=Porites evermanni TaxID=104178 RepID=A0ABN8MHR0_9CNID|nr:unnamed protein product [Porites evermanni]